MEIFFIVKNIPDWAVEDGLSFFDDRFCSAKTDDAVESSLSSFDLWWESELPAFAAAYFIMNRSLSTIWWCKSAAAELQLLPLFSPDIAITQHQTIIIRHKKSLKQSTRCFDITNKFFLCSRQNNLTKACY